MYGFGQSYACGQSHSNVMDKGAEVIGVHDNSGLWIVMCLCS